MGLLDPVGAEEGWEVGMVVGSPVMMSASQSFMPSGAESGRRLVKSSWKMEAPGI